MISISGGQTPQMRLTIVSRDYGVRPHMSAIHIIGGYNYGRKITERVKGN